jgi:hypothetical protein
MTKNQEFLGITILSISATYLISKYVFKEISHEKNLLISAGVSFSLIILYSYLYNKKSNTNGKKIALPDSYSTYSRLKEILLSQGYELKIK